VFERELKRKVRVEFVVCAARPSLSSPPVILLHI
jgi:hypothetical protein